MSTSCRVYFEFDSKSNSRCKLKLVIGNTCPLTDTNQLAQECVYGINSVARESGHGYLPDSGLNAPHVFRQTLRPEPLQQGCCRNRLICDAETFSCKRASWY